MIKWIKNYIEKQRAFKDNQKLNQLEHDFEVRKMALRYREGIESCDEASIERGLEYAKIIGFGLIAGGRTYLDASKIIDMACINHIWMGTDGILHILLERPGILIGKKGADINAIKAEMKAWSLKDDSLAKFETIKLHEDRNILKHRLFMFQYIYE